MSEAFTPQPFTLQPFLSQPPAPAVQLQGELCRNSDGLSIHYVLLDPQKEIIIPTEGHANSRQHDLWNTTCLELFVGPAQSDAYWEVNLAPTGNWNVYRFDAYRSGMREEKTIKALPFLVRHQADGLSLQLDLDLRPLNVANQVLEVAVSAVLLSRDQHLSYWALSHPGPEADFHRRDSFTLRVSPMESSKKT